MLTRQNLHVDLVDAIGIAHRTRVIFVEAFVDRRAAIKGELGQELPLPRHFEQAADMVSEDDVAERVVCGPDPERHLDQIRTYADAHPEAMVFCDTRAAVAPPGQPDRLVSSPDGLHPSPQGYKLMAEALEPSIRAALAKAQALR